MGARIGDSHCKVVRINFIALQQRYTLQIDCKAHESGHPHHSTFLGTPSGCTDQVPYDQACMIFINADFLNNVKYRMNFASH